MAVQSPPFALQNGSHSAALFRQAVSSVLQANGVVGAGEYAVAAQSTPNMSVQVAAGRAWITGTQVANVSGQSFSTQAAYFGLNDAPVTVTIATANATNPRIDLIYAAVQDTFYSGSNNLLVIGVVTGTPAASPSTPAAPNNSVTLATVAVAANATSITNGNISQTPAATLLAAVRGGIDPVLSTDVTAGTYVGQYRDHPTIGPQRWSGSGWVQVAPTKGQARAASISGAGTITVAHGMGVTPSNIQLTCATTLSPNSFTMRVSDRTTSNFVVACYQNNVLLTGGGALDFDWLAYP